MTNTTINNDFDYVSGTHLADAAMFIQSAMRLIDTKDSDAFCLLDKALAEIIAAQDYIENLDPVEAPISNDVAAMLARVCSKH